MSLIDWITGVREVCICKYSSRYSSSPYAALRLYVSVWIAQILFKSALHSDPGARQSHRVDVTAYPRAGFRYCRRVLHVGDVRVDSTDGSPFGNLWLLLWWPLGEPHGLYWTALICTWPQCPFHCMLGAEPASGLSNINLQAILLLAYGRGCL